MHGETVKFYFRVIYTCLFRWNLFWE